MEKVNAKKLDLIPTTTGNFVKSADLMTPVVFAEARALKEIQEKEVIL